MFGIKVLVSLLVLVVLCQLLAAHPRGGRSGGGRSSRGSRGSRARTSKSGRAGTRSIKATSFSSRVYRSQATRGTRARSSKTSIKPQVLYSLSAAPVYRYGYGFHGGYLAIPDAQAFRVYRQTEELTDTNGNSCLPNTQSNYTLIKDAEKFFVESRTKVGYSGGSGLRSETLTPGIQLEGSAVNQNVSVNCTAKYSRTIVPETNCSMIRTRIEGTMVKIVKPDSPALQWAAIGIGIFFGAVFVIIGICALSYVIRKKLTKHFLLRRKLAGKAAW